MSDNKKTREMSDKMFLHKATTKAANSALAFLNAHRDFLLTGSLRQVTEPILSKMDSGDEMPTPTKDAIVNAVYQHMIGNMIDSGTKKIEKESSGEHTTTKNYMATVLNSKGEVCKALNRAGELVDLVKGFDDGERAKGWLDRRLFDGELDWYGQIVHQSITIKGEPMQELVLRPDSIARILKKKKQPTMHERGKSTPSLGFGVKAKQDRASFSRG